MPKYGSKQYWDRRYERSKDPYDWMVDYSSLAPTLEPLLPDRSIACMLVGCGDAPFSADMYYRGGYHNQINVDYSEVVIEKQKALWPEIQWVTLDCLEMNSVEDNSIDVVIDKSLIDTTMCCKDGHSTTMKLYSELHRVLKPGGRLITISLHSEEEILPFGVSNPTCSFTASSCLLSRQANLSNHSLCVFDKVEGLDAISKNKLESVHPISFTNAVQPIKSVRGSESDDDDSVDYNFGFTSQADLLYAFGKAFDDS